jgi:hypothetical protein
VYTFTEQVRERINFRPRSRDERGEREWDSGGGASFATHGIVPLDLGAASCFSLLA